MLGKCQVFTPSSYVKLLLNSVAYKGQNILGKLFLENSCGEGNILVEAVRRYILVAKSNKYTKDQIKLDLERNFIGFEIDSNVRKNCIENLNSLSENEGIYGVTWKIIQQDYLKYKIEEKVDFIVGNPPYIRYQHLSVSDRNFIKETFESCKKGKPDYCYAFIEKSLSDLNDRDGKMSYLIPSSIFKNTFGNELREIMKPDLVKIYDYKLRAVFKGVLTSPSIIVFNKNSRGNIISYIDVDNGEEIRLNKDNLVQKWVFDYEVQHLQCNRNEKFGDYFKVANSVATLLNKVFVIKDYILDEANGKLIFDNNEIEISATRMAASPRAYNMGREERIIFPYYYDEKGVQNYSEEQFSEKFPLTTIYLQKYYGSLEGRTADGAWFEYGRNQSLAHQNQPKLMISSVMTDEVVTYWLSEDIIAYSGFYIIPTRDRTLREAQEILNSDEFFYYFKKLGISASGSSLRYSVNDIKNFPIP